MNAMLDDMELALTDLLQTGLATASREAVKHFAELSQGTGAAGLHTGSALLKNISGLLDRRTHTEEKHDRELIETICRLQHYITLCRERLTEDDIRRRWQEGGTT